MLNSLPVVALLHQNAAQAEVRLRKLRAALERVAQLPNCFQGPALAFKQVSQIIMSFRVSRIIWNSLSDAMHTRSFQCSLQ